MSNLCHLDKSWCVNLHLRCRCDLQLGSCLRSAQNRIANLIGRTFFNVAGDETSFAIIAILINLFTYWENIYII